MSIDSKCDAYIECLENRRFFVRGSLIELGKIGVLIHPFKTIKLKMEDRRLDKIENDIINMSNELNSSKPGYSCSMIQDALEFYMRRFPIDKKGETLPISVKTYKKNKNL